MLSRPGEIVRRHDPDRFLCALFAPPDRRDALFTLYAFNHEIARAREVTREPMMALVRLQWWREVVEGDAKQHEVATPLRQALDAGVLRPAELLTMLDGREAETDTIETTPAWLAYIGATSGALAVAAAHALGTGPWQAIQALGAAYGVAGILRTVRVAAAQGRCLLPADALAQAGLTQDAVVAAPDAPAVQAVQQTLAQHGVSLLQQGRSARVPRAILPAVLPAALARRDLRRPGTLSARGIGDKLAVLRASVTGFV